MLLLLFKKEKKVLEKHWVHANHSYLPPCLLPGGSSVSTEQTGNATQGLPNALPVSPGVAFLTQATSSHGGGTTEYHTKQKPLHNSWGGRTRHNIAFACNKYLPTGRAALGSPLAP